MTTQKQASFPDSEDRLKTSQVRATYYSRAQFHPLIVLHPRIDAKRLATASFHREACCLSCCSPWLLLLGNQGHPEKS